MSLQFLKSQISKHTLAEKMGIHQTLAKKSEQESALANMPKPKLTVKERREIMTEKNKEQMLLRKTKAIAKDKNKVKNAQLQQKSNRQGEIQNTNTDFKSSLQKIHLAKQKEAAHKAAVASLQRQVQRKHRLSKVISAIVNRI